MFSLSVRNQLSLFHTHNTNRHTLATTMSLASDVPLRAIGQGHLAGDVGGLGGLDLCLFFGGFFGFENATAGEENVSCRRLRVEEVGKISQAGRKAARKDAEALIDCSIDRVPPLSLPLSLSLLSFSHSLPLPLFKVYLVHVALPVLLEQLDALGQKGLEVGDVLRVRARVGRRRGGVGLFLRLRRRRLIGGDGEAVDRRGCAVDVSIRSRRGRRPSAAAVCSHCEVTDELYARGEKRETEFFPLPVFLFCLLKRRKKKDEKVRERGRGGALSKIEKQRHRALLFLRRFFSLSQRSNRHALTPCSCPIFVQTPRAR